MKLCYLTASVLAASALLGSSAEAQVRARLVAQGAKNPTQMVQAPGDNTRMFVSSYNDGIHVFENGVLQNDMFLDMNPLGFGPQSVSSVAFHPDYQNNGKFYVVHFDANLNNNLYEYTVTADPNVADPNSQVQILGPEPQTGLVHHWDMIKFGTDGMLYLSTGDGVMSNDMVENHAQDLGNIAGKILRIDVDGGTPYAIPPDNPFVGVPGAREEVWMYGLRQPWKFDWDPLTGDLYIGDTGSSTAEEINVLPPSAGAGRNFGWRCVEGDTCHNFPGCIACNDGSLIEPIYFFPHTEFRCAVVGGIVYRGTEIPALQGRYLFADYCSSRIWTFKYVNGAMQDFEEWTNLFPTTVPGVSVSQITGFARDHAGELYIMDRSDNGRIWKIEPDTCHTQNYCTAGINSAGNGATLSTTGMPSISATDFSIDVTSSIPNQSGLFYYGPLQTSALFGGGFRCVAGLTSRLNPISTSDATGANSKIIDFPNLPAAGQIFTGSAWNFQYWYRDPSGLPSGFNLSDAIEVIFCN
ncbi:MAG: glucose/arabinose dehydrogenase [Planctomycetota bacterium]|jgi:glucose/arabinose dehydrogenase